MSHKEVCRTLFFKKKEIRNISKTIEPERYGSLVKEINELRRRWQSK